MFSGVPKKVEEAIESLNQDEKDKIKFFAYYPPRMQRCFDAASQCEKSHPDSADSGCQDQLDQCLRSASNRRK